MDSGCQSTVGTPGVKQQYQGLTRLIERLHRRFLDVLRAELTSLGVRDINSVQALLLANIGAEELTIRELVERGYYQGSNVSYNIKKLGDLGYLDYERALHDKRSVNIRLTDKALAVVDKVRSLEETLATEWVEKQMTAGEIDAASEALQKLERIWSDYIRYGRR